MKKTTYRIVELKEYPIASLQPHPEAVMPITEDDAFCLGRSIQEIGVMLPPLVLADGRIVDGINRVKQAREAGIQSMLCLVIECHDVHQVASDCMAVGRKRTTGQRIMVYLEAHKTEILKGLKIYGGRMENLKKPNVFPKRSNDRFGEDNPFDFSAEAISERLKVSDKDVRAGIELLAAQEASELPPGVSATTCDVEQYRKAAADKRLEVLSGSLGIRKWRPSISGKLCNAGKGRDDAKYNELARTSAVTLKNCFDNWGTITWRPPCKHHKKPDVIIDEKEVAEQEISTMLAHLPDSFSHVIHQIIIDKWSPAKRGKLLRDLDAKAKSDKDPRK